ncbi:4-hydroxythreonine-4-phosphate dehydrogenase PdxA, partial [Candidatus Poribacteria bacterium]|nr:4-hydroxythreonine-4-phosphate dehydrogenase PdxA [Candidatus Poribacteria bacterium]
NISQFKIGEINKMCGAASVEYILKTYDLLKKKSVQAMVTCPISKEAMSKAGFLYPGHTELLSKLTKTKKYAMMLAGEKLKVVLVTTHMAINKVSIAITKEKVEEKIKLTSEFFEKFLSVKKPKIAVSGLNPHSGEAGMFGNEEIKKITPAIENMKKKGIDVSGPYPADALFYKAHHGIYDAVIVMYHDQGLIPLKMLYMDSGVNITLGLPIIRTSPDHGTAFDIASKGIASPNSLISAIELASNMANKNNQ